MLKKYKHISFDLDGTLVHTSPAYRYKIVPEVVSQLGGEIKNERDIDKFWFEGTRDRVIKDVFGLDPAKFWLLFRQKDSQEKRSEHTFAYDDAEPCLRRLKEAGKLISVITGAPEEIARMEIKKLNGAPMDFYLSIASSSFEEKPSSESFMFVLDKLSVKPEETIYIGNSNEDALFAQNTGADFIYLERKQHDFDFDDWMINKIYSLDELFQ